LPLSATTGGTPANPTAPATAALTQADVSRGTATAATLHAAPSGADAATAAGDAAVAAADAAAASAATSAAASATAAGAAASAAGEAAAALPERPAAPQAGALPVTGRLATTLQPVPAASVGIGADADAPAGGAATAASPVLPVFSLQASADRHGEDAAAARAPPASATTAGSATAGAAELAGLAAAQGAGAPAAVAPAAPQPASPQFPDQLAAHVAYVVDQSLNGATLQVSPPQLGPIELRVSIEAGHAQVWLSAHHATTVDALQQGSARLRELLTGQGFGQVSVDVSQRSFQERQGGTTAYVAARTEEPGLSSVTSGALTAAPARRTASGMLDAYA
jgi:flagellar hook-length control protein FliK